MFLWPVRVRSKSVSPGWMGRMNARRGITSRKATLKDPALLSDLEILLEPMTLDTGKYPKGVRVGNTPTASTANGTTPLMPSS
jgi:hypothetical protein